MGNDMTPKPDPQTVHSDNGKVGVRDRVKGLVIHYCDVLLWPLVFIRSSYHVICGNSSRARFERFGRLDDLESAITSLHKALEIRSPRYPNRFMLLNHLGLAIQARFGQTGQTEDLEQAITLHRQSLDLRPPGHPDRSMSLNNLGLATQTRFTQTGKIEDLEEAIALHRQSLDLLPLGHPGRPMPLNNIGLAILIRFEKMGRMADLEEAITFHRQSLHLLPPGHSDRPMSLNNLGLALQTRFNQTGKIEDLEEAVTFHRQSLELRPPGHPDRSMSLNNLALSIQTRFYLTGRMGDLEEAITLNHQALDLLPPGHPGRPMSLNNIAGAIHTRFKQTGRIEDLQEAIAFHRQSLEFFPPGHPGLPMALNNLGLAIQVRFNQTGRIEDLEESIALHRQALEFRPPEHPDRSMSLNNLGLAIQIRFDQTGRMGDLEEAIILYCQSLDLLPPGHSGRSMSLNNLAGAFRVRFNHTGRIDDLEQAIAFHRQSLELLPPGHPDRCLSLNNLGLAIQTRFDQTGRIEDLEEVIALHRQSLHLRPPGHPDRSMSMNNLASAIMTCFNQTRRIEDLQEAITLHRESLHLLPPGHPNRSMSLNNLGLAIQALFNQTGRIEDLEEVIALHRQSLDLRPLGHPDRSMSLNNLALSIQTRFYLTGRTEDLAEAIIFYRQSLDLLPPGHSMYPTVSSNLGFAIQIHFSQTGKIEDLHESARFLLDAETALPTEHPEHTSLQLRLANNHLEQHAINPAGHHMSTAFALFENAANHHTASLAARMTATGAWVSAALHHKHESLVHAYSISLTLLNRFLIATSSVELRHKFLTSTNTIPKSLASDAASAAIEAGQVETAVEFLEHGRAMLWSELRGLRPPLEELRKVNPELADQFESLCGQLEHYAMSFESASMGSQLMSEQGSQEKQIPFEVRQQSYRIISEEQAKVIDSIREIEGFTDFLNPVPFNTLRKAAVHGPVIIINISRRRSDAIIVRHVDPPVLVPLRDAWSSDLALLSSKLSKSTASKADDFSMTILSMLRDLWNMIVHPVTDQLAELGVAEGTRIWWCPTSDLCALPLHAAGPYSSGQKSLPDIYISSYTASLSVLIAARSGIVRRVTTPNLLVVGDIGQPSAPIPSVEEELRQISSFGNFVNVLFGEEANRDAVLAHLPQYHWIHLACHGHRHPEPFHSFFQLHSRQRLELLDLIQARLPNAEFAFLSACHAAAADIGGTPDEVIHLAGAMQFCGFRSVVGTLWAMADIDGPDVARDFYGYMFRDLENIVDFRDSASALNIATREMRRRKVPLSRWVNFVHIGA